MSKVTQKSDSLQQRWRCIVEMNVHTAVQRKKVEKLRGGNKYRRHIQRMIHLQCYWNKTFPIQLHKSPPFQLVYTVAYRRHLLWWCVCVKLEKLKFLLFLSVYYSFCDDVTWIHIYSCFATHNNDDEKILWFIQIEKDSSALFIKILQHHFYW